MKGIERQVEPEKPTFTALYWRKLSDGRPYATVRLDREYPFDGTGLIGPVVIDGVDYECTSVGRWANGQPMRAGQEVDLLINGSKRKVE